MGTCEKSGEDLYKLISGTLYSRCLGLMTSKREMGKKKEGKNFQHRKEGRKPTEEVPHFLAGNVMRLLKRIANPNSPKIAVT